jgi:hypothetical protein
MTESKYKCKFCGSKLKVEVNKEYNGTRFLERVYLCDTKEFTEFNSVKWFVDWNQVCENKKAVD